MTDPRVEPLPFAVYDEFGNGADDRVQDHIRAQIERLQAAQGQVVATPVIDLDEQARFDAGCKVLEYLRQERAPVRITTQMLVALHGDPEARPATPAPSPAHVAAGRAMEPLEDMRLHELWWDTKKGSPDANHRPYGEAVIAEFCRINGLTAGGSKAGGAEQ